MTTTKEELKKQVEQLAAEQGATPLQVISELQTGAAKAGADDVLEMLCELKWEFI